jgi:hypothetical protein
MKRRPRGRSVLPALMVGLMTAVLAVPTAASAATEAHNAKAPILAHNGACGASKPALKHIGFVNFHRVGNTVSLNVHLKGGNPHARYNVFLFENAPKFCHLIDGRLGTIRTNGAGVGNGHFKVLVPAKTTKFFADPTVKPTPFIAPSNDTSTVMLP